MLFHDKKFNFFEFFVSFGVDYVIAYLNSTIFFLRLFDSEALLTCCGG